MASSRAGASAELHPDNSHRASLFGSSFGLGGGSSTQSRSASSAASSMQQALEEDNNRLTDDLSQKVSALRYASQSIHDEVSEQNRLLSGMVRAQPTLMLAHFCACAPLAEPPECPSFPHSAPPSVPCASAVPATHHAQTPCRAWTLKRRVASWGAPCSAWMAC